MQLGELLKPACARSGVLPSTVKELGRSCLFEKLLISLENPHFPFSGDVEGEPNTRPGNPRPRLSHKLLCCFEQVDSSSPTRPACLLSTLPLLHWNTGVQMQSGKVYPPLAATPLSVGNHSLVWNSGWVGDTDMPATCYLTIRRAPGQLVLPEGLWLTPAVGRHPYNLLLLLPAAHSEQIWIHRLDQPL